MAAEAAYRAWLTSQGRRVDAMDEKEDFVTVRAVDAALPELADASVVHEAGRTSVLQLLFELPTHPGYIFAAMIQDRFEDPAQAPYHVTVHVVRPGLVRNWLLWTSLDDTGRLTTLKLRHLQELLAFHPDAEKSVALRATIETRVRWDEGILTPTQRTVACLVVVVTVCLGMVLL